MCIECFDNFTHAAAGVTPVDGAIFILMEIIGAVLAVLVFKAVTRKNYDES